MSVPEASGTRQRKQQATVEDDKVSNPASLSANPDKKVARNKPKVKPPFVDVPMNKFLLYLVGSLLLVAVFYMWRFTVWAAVAGGYWNLVTGRRAPPVTGAAEKIARAAASASSVGSKSSASPSSHPAAGADVQSQIYALASALGVKPADISAAIRPLIDPSVPNPAEAAQREVEMLRQQVQMTEGGAGTAKKEEEVTGGLLGTLGEVLLD